MIYDNELTQLMQKQMYVSIGYTCHMKNDVMVHGQCRPLGETWEASSVGRALGMRGGAGR